MGETEKVEEILQEVTSRGKKNNLQGVWYLEPINTNHETVQKKKKVVV